jgi:hypothetical protein
MRREILIIACLVAVFAAQSAHAISLTVSAQKVAVFDEVFNPLPMGTFYGFPVIYQYDFSFTIHSLSPGEDGFGSLSFDVRLINLTDPYGWQSNSQTIDSNGTAPGGIMPIYATNADLGFSTTDNRGILIQMASGAFTNPNDPRRNIGEPGGIPGYFGSLFLRQSGNAWTEVQIRNVQYYAKSTTGQLIGPFGDVPEPSSLVLGGLSLIGLAFRRRLA